MMTPFEKLQSLDNAAQYLKEGVTLQQLEAFATEMTDNKAAAALHAARRLLFKTIREQELKQA